VKVLVPEPGPNRDQLAFVVDGTENLLGPEALAEADLVLIPALAVDRSGTRLGQGGGWYDRVLGFVTSETPILAVVFSDEILPADTLPREPHDLPVSGALTPNGLEWFTRGRR
jgi:5-formyltetrahydrofolate cyclo-ligase